MLIRFSDWYDRALRRPRAWRDQLLFVWYTHDKGWLGFGVILALPLLILGAFAGFARTESLQRLAAEQRRTDLNCLAENVYHEARGEPRAGQYAVAEVTLNRVASPQFPDTVCEVVHEKRFDALRRRPVGAFSWTELEALRQPRGRAWQQAMAVAIAVYDRQQPRVVADALYYHADSIEPRWAREKQTITTIGRHVFYR